MTIVTELLSFTLGQVKHWIQSGIKKYIYNMEKHIHKPGSTAVDGNLLSIVNAAHNSVDWRMTQLPCEVPGATLDSLDHEGCPHSWQTGHRTDRRSMSYSNSWQPGRLLWANESSLDVCSGLHCSSRSSNVTVDIYW